MWILFFLVGVVSAHMPTSECDLHYDIQSWASYIYVNGTETCNIHTDDILTLNINVPYHEERNVVIDVQGMGPCEDGVTGWGHDGEVGDIFYEAFGVGAYKMLYACKANTTGDVSITLTADNVPVNLGVGEAEYFSLLDLFLMPIKISNTWIWEGHTWFFLPGLIFFMFNIMTIKKTTKNIVQLFLVINAIQFLAQILSLWSYLNETVLASLAIHVVIPLIFALLYECKCKRKVTIFGRTLFILYSALFLWQGFWVPFVFATINVIYLF